MTVKILTEMAAPTDWAAWAQFFAGLMAVAAAVLVPYLQRRHQIQDARRDRDAQIAVMRVALQQPLDTMALRCISLAKRFQANNISVRPPDLFLRPPEFDQFRPNLHLLGDVGQEINSAIGELIHAGVIWEAICNNPTHDANFIAASVARLNTIGNRLKACEIWLRTGERPAP